MKQFAVIMVLASVTAVVISLIWSTVAERIHRRKMRHLSDELEKMGLVACIDPPPGQPRTAGIYIERLPRLSFDTSGSAASNAAPTKKGKAMTEEQKPVTQPPETALEARLNKAAVGSAEQLPIDFVGQKVRVWSHHQTNQAFEGKVISITLWGIRLRSLESRELFVSWEAGPIVQVLEY